MTTREKELANELNQNGKKTIEHYLTSEKEKQKELTPFNEMDRDRWCNTIYSDGNFKDWKGLVTEIGKDIVEIAIDGKADCPTEFFRKMFR